MACGGQLCIIFGRQELMTDPPLFAVGDVVYDGVVAEPQRVNEIQWDDEGQSWLCWLKHSVVFEWRLTRTCPNIGN